MNNNLVTQRGILLAVVLVTRRSRSLRPRVSAALGAPGAPCGGRRQALAPALLAVCLAVSCRQSALSVSDPLVIKLLNLQGLVFLTSLS